MDTNSINMGELSKEVNKTLNASYSRMMATLFVSGILVGVTLLSVAYVVILILNGG